MDFAGAVMRPLEGSPAAAAMSRRGSNWRKLASLSSVWIGFSPKRFLTKQQRIASPAKRDAPKSTLSRR